MARENFSIGAFYNITKNQDNPIKTVVRDSFLSSKAPKIPVFRGHPAQGSHSPYIIGDTTRPRHVTYVQASSKSDQRRLRKTLHKENRQTNRQYENNGHLAVNQICLQLIYGTTSWSMKQTCFSARILLVNITRCRYNTRNTNRSII